MAYLCGVALFCANLFIFLAAQTAAVKHYNIDILPAISTGLVLIGLAGSYFIYKEKQSRLQYCGSFTIIVGLLLLAFSATRNEIGGKELYARQNSEDGLKFVISESLIGLFFLGGRFTLAKYCSKILSPAQFTKLNFISDPICSLFVIILASLNMIRLDLSAMTTNQNNFILFTVMAGAFNIMGELFAFKAISEGPFAPTVALISANTLLVSILLRTINQLTLAPL